jgi:hypothetical protein
VKELFKKFTLVQLYTDEVPASFKDATSANENSRLLSEEFKTAQLPTYVILKPLGDGKYAEVGRYEEGKINNVAGFVDFLRKPLEASPENGAVAQAR